MIELNPGSNTVQSSPSGFPQVSQPDPSDPDYEYQLETFQTIDDILTDIETILDILEVFINGADFLKYWVLDRYYDSGYAFGSASLGTVILIKDIVLKIE